MATLEQIQEIADRGIQDRLSPERKARFDEMVGRGMITLPQTQAPVTDILGALEELQPSVEQSVPGTVAPSVPQPSVGETIPGMEAPSVEQNGMFGQQPGLQMPSLEGYQLPDLNAPADFNLQGLSEKLQGVPDMLQGAGSKVKSELELLQSTNHKGVGTLPGGKIQSLKDRFSLGLTDSPEEKTQGLIDKYGEDGFIENKVAGIILTPNGLLKGGYAQTPQQAEQMGNVTLGEMGLSMGDVADVSNIMPEIVVGTATAVASSGLSLIPALLATATTTGLVKFGQEEIEALMGDNSGGMFGKEQNTREDRADMGLTAAKWSAGGEVASRTFIAAGRKLFQGWNLEQQSAFKSSGGWPKLSDMKDNPKEFFGQLKKVTKAIMFGKLPEKTSKVDPIKLRVQQDAEDLGVTLPLEQGTGGRNPILDRAEAAAETIYPDIRKARQQKNVKVLTTEGNRLINKAGETPKGVEKLVAKDGDSVGLVDDTMQAKLTKADTASTKKLDEIDASINQSIGKEINRMKTLKPTDEVGEGAQKGIKKIYDDSNTKTGELYAEIDNVLPKNAKGEIPKVVPTGQIRKAISGYLEENFMVKTIQTKAKNGKVVTTKEYKGVSKEAKELFDGMMSADKMQGFQAIHASRSRLRKLAYNEDFLKTVDDRFFRIMEQAHDDALKSAQLGGSYKAKQALARADEFYKSQIPKFDNLFIKSLLRDARKGGVKPSQVVGKIENAAKEDVAILFKGDDALLSPTAQKEVRASIVNGWMENAGLAKGVDEIKVSHIQTAIKKMQKKGTFGDVFGSEGKAISSLAKSLDAKNAKLSLKGKKVDDLDPSELKDLMKESLDETAKRDAFQAEHFVAELQKKGGDAQDTLLYLLHPNRRNKIRSARKLIGENTAEWSAVREGAMKQLLDGMIDHTEDVGRIIIKGEGLLKKLMPGEGSMKPEIIELFGKPMYDELLKFSRVSTAAGRETSKSSALLAAALALAPVKNISRLIGLNRLAKFMNSPKGLKFMTTGIERALKLRQGVAGATRAGSQATAQNAREELGGTVKATVRGAKVIGGVASDLGKASLGLLGIK